MEHRRMVMTAAMARPGRNVSVVTRKVLRVHAQIRQNRPILSVTPARVPQNQTRKALGGGTALVHHAS
jgi:hypothetical protein